MECQEKIDIEKEKAGGKGRKRKSAENFDEKHIYVGETSRSLYERTKKNMEDAIW